MVPSFLPLALLLGCAARSAAAANVPVCGAITTSTTWTKNNIYKVNCVTYVQPGATLTVEPGTVVEAKGRVDLQPAVAIIVHRGARIVAEGTAEEPITFTTQENIDHYWTPARADLARGMWSGVVILGRAPVPASSKGIVDDVSCPNCAYGGDVELDSSGSLEHVRIWYAGHFTGFRAGLTLAGVGSGTAVHHVDVAWNLVNGVEIIGGAVNVKHVSSTYNGAAAIRLSEGYQGLMQHVFALVSITGSEALVVDSTGDDRRTHPKLYNALLVGSMDSNANAVVTFSNGAGGEFGNIVIMNAKRYAVRQESCGTVVNTRVKPTPGSDDYGTLWWSGRNVVHGEGEFFAGCGDLSSMDRSDPMLLDIPSFPRFDSRIDPRPKPDSILFEFVDQTPNDPHDFFEYAVFRGAFGSAIYDVWIGGYTWMAAHNGLAEHLERAVVVAGADRRSGFADRNVIIGVGVLAAAVVVVLAAAAYYFVRFKRVESKYEDRKSVV